MSHGPIYLWQLIYQAKTGPVEFTPPFAETVSEDRFHQPWSEPSVKAKIGLGAHQQQFLAYCEAATQGGTFKETVSEDRWHQPWSEPSVKARPGLGAHLQQVQPYEETARFPEIVSEDRWHQPFSEPVRVKPALPAGEQQFIAQSESAQFPETVSEDRWHQPWSEPSVKTKAGLPASEQQFLAAQPFPVISITWFNWLSEPVRTKPGLAASEHQFLALCEAAPFPETVSEDRWHQPWSEPVRQKLGIAVTEHPLVSFDPAVFVPGIDAWGSPLTEPVRIRSSLAAAAQQFLASTPFVSSASVDGWGAQFSIPQRQLLGLPAGEQQFLAYAESAPFPETVSEDRWHQRWAEPIQLSIPWKTGDTSVSFAVIASTQTSVASWAAAFSEPVRQKPGLPAGEQQFLAFTKAAPFPETVSEDRWHQPFSEPVRVKPALPAAEQLAPVFADPQPFVSFSWLNPFSEPVRRATNVAVQSTTTFTATTAVFEDSWHQRWADPIQLSAPWKTGDNSVSFPAVQAATAVPSVAGWAQPWANPAFGMLWEAGDTSYGFGAAQAAVPSIDGWGSPFAEVPKPKIGLNVAAQQALAFVPVVTTATVLEDSWHQRWSDPIQLSAPWKTGDNSVSFAAVASAAPNFGYFAPFSEPQRQLPGLGARYQQDAAYGFVPIVQAFVFFFGNEEPLPWPGFRVNQFIRENYDQLAFPPFPIPNPPVTQGKFTVSGPDVRDLFPVSGVVYPYAPETRKTVP